MKKKISWMELVIVIALIFFVVKGWGWWSKKKIEVKLLPTPIIFEVPTPSNTLIPSQNTQKDNEEKDIFDAIKEVDLERIRKLIKENPNIANFQKKYYGTPLHYAVLRKNKEIVELLIENRSKC